MTWLFCYDSFVSLIRITLNSRDPIIRLGISSIPNNPHKTMKKFPLGLIQSTTQLQQPDFPNLQESWVKNLKLIYKRKLFFILIILWKIQDQHFMETFSSTLIHRKSNQNLYCDWISHWIGGNERNRVHLCV